MYQAKTVVAPLDRVKILFQASNPDFQKYAGTSRQLKPLAPPHRAQTRSTLLQEHGAEPSARSPRYIAKTVCEVSSKATPLLYSVSLRTQPLSS